MNEEQPWISKYAITVLKIYLRQTKGDVDTRSLLPPSLSALDDYFRSRISEIVKPTERGYVCSFCGGCFNSRKSMYLHLIKKHGREVSNYALELIREVEDRVKKTGDVSP